MNSRNAFADAKAAALTLIADAQSFDLEYAAAVSAAASRRQLLALQELTNKRHDLHAKAAEATRYLIKLGTKHTTDPTRAGILRGDAERVSEVFNLWPSAALGSQVVIDVATLEEARDVFDKVLAAAWPRLLAAHRLPLDTPIVGGVFDGFMRRHPSVGKPDYLGQVSFTLSPSLVQALPRGFICADNKLRSCK